MDEELFERFGVDAVILDVPCYDLSSPVYRCRYRYSLEANLLPLHENMTVLRSVPNFRCDLPATKHRLIHEEEVLPPIIGLEDSTEAHSPTLMLPTKLTR